MNQEYIFVTGKGYQFFEGCRVQIDIFGKPISKFDTGRIIKRVNEWEYEVRNDRTGKIEVVNYKNLLPDKNQMRNN